MNPQLTELLEIYRIKPDQDFRRLIFLCDECGDEANYSRMNGVLIGGCRCDKTPQLTEITSKPHKYQP